MFVPREPHAAGSAHRAADQLDAGAGQPDREPGASQPDAEQSASEADAGEPGREEPDREPDAGGGEPGGEDRPRVVPIPLPEGLADAPAGAWLCEALDGVDVELVSGFDTVEVMSVAYRQANRQRAIFMRTLLETGLRAPDSADEVVRISTPGEFSAEEARAALVWSRRRAETAMGLAADVFDRLPARGEAMLGGWLDEPRARAFTEWTTGLTGEQAATICVDLLPVASGLMVGELVTRIQRAVYAIDPDWAQRRYEDAVADRRIIASRNEDGTANLEGRNLPVDRAAAACDRIDTLARAVKHAGAGKRRIDHIRVDLFLGSTDGTFEGMSDEEIITHVVNHPLVTDPNPDTEPNDGDATSTSGSDGTGDDVTDEDAGTGFTNDDSADDEAYGTGDGGEAASGNDDGDEPYDEPGDGGEPGPDGPGGVLGDDGGGGVGDDSVHGGAGASDTGDARDSAGVGAADVSGSACSTGGPAAGATARPFPCGWAVQELRVELATLLGRDDHPGEIPGTGYLPAMLARRLAAAMGSAQWRYVICSPLGRLITCGILATRPYPDGAPRRDVRRGGIVEIAVRTGQLDQLATTIGGHGQWAGVITELVHRYAQDLADTDARFGNVGPDHGTRTPNRDQGTSAPSTDSSTSVADDGHDPAAGDVAADGHPAGSDPPADGQTHGQRRRLPGAKLRREIQMRDRQCVHIACRMPATRTDLDHAHDYVQGGLTTAANMAAVCRWHHRLKHDGGWTVSKPEPAITRWDTTLGHRYVAVPPLVMPRLPSPRPRRDDGYDLLPDQITRGCGCFGHCTCGPTMPTDRRTDNKTETATEAEHQTKSRAEYEPAPDGEDRRLSFDSDIPPY